MIMKKIIFLFSILLIFSSISFASFISLKTTFSAKIVDNTLKVDLSSVNKGDESALNVQAEIKIGNKYLIAEKKPELKVGETYSFFESIFIPQYKPGNYPAILTLHYTDANEYPFSAVSCQTYQIGKKIPSSLSMQGRSTAISAKGKVKLTIKNPGGLEVKGTISLIAPKEIVIANNPHACAIKPRSQNAAFFEISNASALSGSTYNLFGIFEYDDNGQHFSIITPLTVKIRANDGFLGMSYSFIFILLISLVALFVFFQFKRK